MTFLIEKLLLNVLKLPANWNEIMPQIVARELHLDRNCISGCEIISASIDSRRGSPKLQLKLLLTTSQTPRGGVPVSAGEIAAMEAVSPVIPEHVTLRHPIVVGTGPAGISAAYLLAKAGCAPLVIDRGFPVEQRIEDYRSFLQSRVLDESSNLLIGEGGAGTFSDGKLYTGTKDWRGRFLKKLWVECGAPEEILWRSRPHIGSDKLPGMCANLRCEIEKSGGTFRFGTEVVDIIVKSGRCAGVKLASGEEISAPLVIFAPGLGGRDLVRAVCRHAAWELKFFQTGCRVEHPQEIIDRAMYHLPRRPAALGAAEYHIVSRAEAGNVSSFCMCPGGTVVNAASQPGRSVTNGMSCFARNGEFANSCLITTIDPAIYQSADELFDHFAALEKRIFEAGGADYTFPAQDVSAFISGRSGLNNIRSSCDTGIIPGRLDQLLPQLLKNALLPAVRTFDRKIPGFIAQGKFIGAESFVSSPVRICRDQETKENPLLPGLYPAGEGCGLAGGIVSAACDGLLAAEAALNSR